MDLRLLAVFKNEVKYSVRNENPATADTMVTEAQIVLISMITTLNLPLLYQKDGRQQPCTFHRTPLVTTKV